MEHANEVLRSNDVALETFLRPRVDEARRAPRGRASSSASTPASTRSSASAGCSHRSHLHAVSAAAGDRVPRPRDLSLARRLRGGHGGDPRRSARRARAGRGRFRALHLQAPGSPVDQWLELNNSKRWSTFFLWKNGERVEEHLARCPRTAALLEAAPLCEIRAHAPPLSSRCSRRRRASPRTPA